MLNYGYQNEFDFVELFNGKYLNDLDDNSQRFLKELFHNKIDNNEPIKSWKNKFNQKSDIFIKYGNYIKGVSIKFGKSHSIHHETLQEFRMYLEKFNIPYNDVNKYVNYHYGYKKDEDGNTDYLISLSSEEYKELYQKDLDIFNNEINKTRIIVDMVDRFIVRGRNSEYDIDALVCGSKDDYVWIMKHEIYDLILSKRNLECTSPHIACLTIGPKLRNLNHNSKSAKDRFLVCIRWYNIREDILSFKSMEASK